MCRDLRVRCGSETRRIAYRPGGSFGGEAGRTGTPKAECMKTILNTDRLNRLTARIPPPWAEDLSPATASCDVGITQPAESLPRNSALWSALFPAPSELAVWRQIWRLRNKDRAREANPLISANPLFSQRGETLRGETWRAPPGGARRPPGRRRAGTSAGARAAHPAPTIEQILCSPRRSELPQQRQAILFVTAAAGRLVVPTNKTTAGFR